MGAMEELEWGEGRGIMHINCSLPEENLLVCDAEERVQKWKLSRDYIFSKIGILSHRIFHTKGVTAKKYYEVSNRFLLLNENFRYYNGLLNVIQTSYKLLI